MSKLREAVEALLTHIDKCAGSPRMGCVFADDPAVLAVRSALSADDEGDAAVDVVFDGPPSHESGRFVETEDVFGASVSVGEWIDRGDGMWALRIKARAIIAAWKGGK